jgi:hypothetical protein
MDPSGSRVRAVCAAIVAFDLGFLSPSFVSVPVLWYLPLLRRWELVLRPDGLAMDWYGRLLLGGLLGAATLLLGSLARRRAPSDSSLRLWMGWAAIATLLALSLQVYQLVSRQPRPEPLPAWYQPR